MTIRITNAAHEDCVLAAGVVGNATVVSCPNPADAASPVYLHAGQHGRSLGQSADYRHHLDGLISIHDAVLVQSWWDNAHSQWYTTIDGMDDHESAVREFIRDREEHRVAKIEADSSAKAESARQQTVASDKTRIAEAMAMCRMAAEQWAPGRVAVRMANDREIIVGRWNAPNIPGYGMPEEVRRVVRGEAGQPELVACNESYRYAFA